MTHKAHVLIVDDEPNVRKVLAALLEQAGYATKRAGSGEEAVDLVRAQDPDLVITDLRMPGMDGLELLRKVREDYPEIPVVLLTAHGTVETAVEAMKRGAHDFLTKPFDKKGVLETVGKALEHANRGRKEFQGPLSREARCGIVGQSAPMQKLFRLVERVAPTPATALIIGETGTGKELVAEALHQLSTRRDGPLVRINCGALPENLVEAELFGYERGAFTGADRAKPGRFELADGGTLFLDEIGELPLPAQVKILRILQDLVVERIGGTESRVVDVRLVAATNRDLETAVTEGGFREDLFHRLRVVEIRIPPLRERLDDLALLVEFFLDKHAKRLQRPRPSVTPEAITALSAGEWKGNVRQLENAVERAILLSDNAELTPADFDLAPGQAGPPPEKGMKAVVRAVTADAERRLIRAALEATAGNVTQAAERLSLSRRGLQIKMKDLGLRSQARS